MLDTVYISGQSLTLPTGHVIQVSPFEIMPEHLNIRDWAQISGESGTSRIKKTVGTKRELETILKTLEEKTFVKWRLPSESEMEVFHEQRGVTGRLDGWSVLGDAWSTSDQGRPEDGSAFPSTNHRLDSRLLMRWSPTRGKFIRGWVTYNDASRWDPGLLVRLVKCESSEKTIEWFGLQ